MGKKDQEIRKKYHRKILDRSNIAIIVLILAFIALIFRLFWLQVICHDHYRQSAFRQHWKKRKLPARRGEIKDRNGVLLAVSRDSYSCYADPSRIEDPPKTVKSLCSLLDLPPEKLLKRLSNKKKRFVWIKRMLDKEKADQIKNLKIKGIGFREEPNRYYPHGKLASHILGFVGIDHHGLDGLESTFGKELSGENGYNWGLKDGRLARSGIYTPEAPSKETIHGADLYLTIDIIHQNILEQQLDRVIEKFQPLGAAAVLIEVSSREIIAISSRPTFDPNHFQKSSAEDRRNLALTAFELGSVMKPFVAAAAFHLSVVDEKTQVNCHNGRYRTSFGRLITDSHAYGMLDVAGVIIHSSNIGAALIGSELGPHRLHSFLSRMNFGKKIGLPLPGENAGTMRPPTKWNKYTMTSIPMGYEIRITPVQMAGAYTVLAGDGIYIPPTIIKKLVYQDGKIAYPKPRPKTMIYPAQISARMRKILRKVVEEGTATRANVKLVEIAGKTGTAQKYDPEIKRYNNRKHISVFAGFAPAENPIYVCLFAVDQPKGGYSGGRVAAPYVAKVLQNACLVSKK